MMKIPSDSDSNINSKYVLSFCADRPDPLRGTQGFA
jgi:hypothetical protein